MARYMKVKKKKNTRKQVGLVALYLIPLVGLLFFGGYYFNKYNDLKNTPPPVTNAEAALAAEETRIINEVSQLYDVPKDEKPRVAAVKDKELLKKDNPNFFEKAENGDYVVIYQKALIAILYRPSSKQLIKVGPLQIQQNPTIKVLGQAGAERQAVEKQLSDAKLAFTDAGEPKTEVVTGLLVVDLKGTNAKAAQELAAKLPGATVGPLPEGEDKPEDVDILVIVGAPQEPF